jgi:hypothetical protein
MSSQLDVALIETLRPMVKRMVHEEIEKEKLGWRWQSTRRAAETLDMSENAIRKRIGAGSIPARKFEGRWYVDMEALDRQLARLQ